MALVKMYGNGTSYDIAVIRGRRTQTGWAIWDFLQHDGRDFDVVVLNPGETFGQMMVESDPQSEETVRARDAYQAHTGTRTLARPTVFWCPTYEFDYYGDVDGVTMQRDGTIMPMANINNLPQGAYYYAYRAGKRVVSVPVIRYTRASMPSWLVLYHELGHVKQYYQPRALLPQADVVDLWNIRLTDTASIEAENLALHENPICRQIQIAERKHYKHMANGMGNVASAYAVNKAPALRVANNAADRVLKDAELLALATHGQPVPETGFFIK